MSTAFEGDTRDEKSGNATWTLTVVSIATFMLMLDLTVSNVALPTIRKEFDSSFSSLQWILDAYALGLAAFLLAAGSLADRVGRKKVFDGGLVIFVLASLACGLAPTDTVLIVARLVQGIGGGVLFAVGPALIGHEFRGSDRGKAFGVFGAVAGLAIAFGPLIGGFLTDTFSWRWIFLINVPLTVVALAIGFAKMRESRSATPPPLDIAGMITFSTGLFFLVLGFLRGQADGWSSGRVLTCFSLAVALGVVFVVIQITRRDRAMFQLSLFRNTSFNGLSAVTALCAASTMAALFLMISYLQNVLGFSAFATGLRCLPLTLLLCVAAAAAGSLVTRVRPSILMGVSQLFIAAGLLCVLLIRTDTAWPVLVPAMLLVGLGMGLFNPVRAALSIAVTTPDKAGMASGVNETFQQVGLAVGIAAIGALFQNRVAADFVDSPTGRMLGDRSSEAGDAVAAGGVNAVADSVPEFIADTVREAALTAFVDGLHDVMLLSAIFAAVSAVIAFVAIRRKDLDAAALAHPMIIRDEADPVEQIPLVDVEQRR